MYMGEGDIKLERARTCDRFSGPGREHEWAVVVVKSVTSSRKRADNRSNYHILVHIGRQYNT